MARLRGNRVLRTLDRYIGIPLVAALGLRSRRSLPDLSAVRRLGLMKSVAIGDMVLLSGVIADVRAHAPRATIVIVSGEDNSAIADLIAAPGDERIVISPNYPIESVRRLRAARLDGLLDFGAWPRFDAVLSAMSGAGFTAGFATSGQFRHRAYDHAVEYLGDVHEVENNRRLARIIGVSSTSLPSIPAAPAIENAPPRPYVVFQPWAGGFRHELREWSVESWCDLARRLRGRGWTIVVAGSQADAEASRALCAALDSSDTAVVNGAGRFSLAGLTRVLRDAEVVISVNTGVMHLAAAVGAHVVGLQGPTSSRRWGPLGENSRAVDSRLPSCGYLNLGWEYEGRRTDCMSGISVDAVVAAIDSLTAG